MTRRTWVGLDPAIGAFGFAIMHRELGGQPFVAEMGTWRTRPDPKAGKLEDRARRVKQLIGQLVDLFDRWSPHEAYIESAANVHGQQSYHSIAAAGRMRGVVEGLCFVRGIELAEIRPDIVKQAVTGRRDAGKDQVASMVGQLYYGSAGRIWCKRDLDATDALAVAHVGAHRYGHGVTVSSGVVQYRRDVEADDVLDF